jgi:hypothetical protein
MGCFKNATQTPNAGHRLSYQVARKSVKQSHEFLKFRIFGTPAQPLDFKIPVFGTFAKIGKKLRDFYR